MRYLKRLYKTHSIVGYFLLIYTAFNVLQALSMPLTPLEAYVVDPAIHFWQLGYPTQAPMIHWWVYIGQYCFGDHLQIGVRSLSIISGIVSTLIIWHLVPISYKKRKQLAFVSIIATVLPLHFFSFLSLEESPLLLFTGIFLLTLYHFQKNIHYLNALFLGISIALLLYTRYESILLIILSFSVFYTFFKKRPFYIALLTALILFSPHLWWLHTHQYVSWQQVYEQYTQWSTPSNSPLNIIWETLKNQFLYAGFLLPIICIYVLITQTPIDRFSLLLKIVLLIYVLLYSILSIYTEVPFWKVGNVLPYALVVIAYQYYLLDKGWQNAITVNFLIAITFIISIRVGVAKNEFALFGNTKRMLQQLRFLANLSDDASIALTNNPHKIAVAHLYLPEYPFFALNTQAQYPNEKSHLSYIRYTNQPVILVSDSVFPKADTFFYYQKLFFYTRIPSFQYKGAATITPENHQQYYFSPQDSFLYANIDAPYALSQFIPKDSLLLCTLKNHLHPTQTLPATYQILQKINHSDHVHYKVKIYASELLYTPFEKGTTLSINFEQNGIPYHKNTAYPLKSLP